MTNETKHTPGPWELLDRNERGDIWVGPSRETHPLLLENGVGIVMIREIMGQLAPDEVKANANLIKAAPDLLEALQALMPLIRITDATESAWENAAAAIAKATGA